MIGLDNAVVNSRNHFPPTNFPVTWFCDTWVAQFVRIAFCFFSQGLTFFSLMMVNVFGHTGKTSILYKMKMGELVTTIPTIGFNVESIKYQNVSFTVWDVAGQRSLWRHYFDNIQGLIFVVDSNDKERISEARDQLHKLLENSELSNVKLMVFANKQDLTKVLTTKEVTDRLHLSQLKQKREWHVQACSATTGEGLREGLHWLAAALKDSPGKTTNGYGT